MFPVKYQVTWRIETGKMISVASLTPLKPSQSLIQGPKKAHFGPYFRKEPMVCLFACPYFKKDTVSLTN